VKHSIPVPEQSTSRIIEITHFSKDKKPNKLTIDAQPPSLNENGFPEEGGYFLRIGDAVFHLTEAEASHLALTLLETHRQHTLQFAKISGERRKKGEEED